MKTAIRHLLILGILLTSSTLIFSQRSSVTGNKFKVKKVRRSNKALNYINHIDFVWNIGSASYLGELCAGTDCIKLRPSLGLGLQYRHSENLSFRIETGYLRLYGSDKNGKNSHRGLSFRSDNFEFLGSIVYDILKQNKMYRRRYFASPYIHLGIGLLHYNPKTLYDGQYHDLRPLQTEGVAYSSLTGIIPYGLGIRFKVGAHLNIATEMNWRLVFSDYLDDVSGSYDESKADLPDDDLAKILSDRRTNPTTPHVGTIRGNPKSNDYYFLFNIKFDYTLKVTKQRYNINSNVSRFRILKGLKKK